MNAPSTRALNHDLAVVAAIQYRPPKGDPSRARAELGDLLLEALATGAKVVVAPEMATTGYVWESAAELRPFAEAADGPTGQMLAELAAEHGATIVVGFAESSGVHLYNSALIVSADQPPTVYRKRLLFDLDTTWATPGDRYMTVDTAAGSAVPAICMDLNDDRLATYLWKVRPAMLLFCANWLDQGVDVTPYWRARLGRWRGVVVAANNWGEERGVRFRGHSAILRADGSVAALAQYAGDQVISAVVETPQIPNHGSTRHDGRARRSG